MNSVNSTILCITALADSILFHMNLRNNIILVNRDASNSSCQKMPLPEEDTAATECKMMV